MCGDDTYCGNVINAQIPEVMRQLQEGFRATRREGLTCESALHRE